MNAIVQTLKNNWAKYLIEALVITFSIIGAFMLDNWKEERQNRKEEQVILMGLKEEFLFNKKELERARSINNSNRKGALELSKFMGPQKPQLTEVEFSSLFLNTFDTEVQYRPSTGVLSEIISSGKLAIFTNNELKAYLASWDGAVLKSLKWARLILIQATCKFCNQWNSRIT